jgi:hypothetical protein
MSLGERQSLNELRVICTIGGELGLLTYQSCGLTLMYWDWLQEVGMLFKWFHMVQTQKINTFLYMLQRHWKDLKRHPFLKCVCVCPRVRGRSDI